ncbi:unnamed protein product [Spirodela intermedia]|uniref:Protein kinase domain-containing protein n=1 Tax=Spirodela intermedia TaxID=51605 RepID=A0A7I8KDM9_SPIIN|nr:unnamed protein product [Spirodela intermedia]
MGCFRTADIASEEGEEGEHVSEGSNGGGGGRRSSVGTAAAPPGVTEGGGSGRRGEVFSWRKTGRGSAAAVFTRVMARMKALNLVFVETRRSLSLNMAIGRRRTALADEEKPAGGSGNRSWLLGEGARLSSSSAPAALAAEPHTAHSSFRYSFFDSQLEVEPVVLMVSEDEQPAAAPASAAHDHALLIRWRRIESLERSISPVAGTLIRFSYQEISSATVDFHPGRLLGRGALSRVYRGRVGLGGGRRRASVVAVKRLQGEEKECVKSFYRELMIASGLRHPNVAPLLGFCVDPQGLFLVYKFISGGSLDHHLHPGGVLPWGARWKVAVGLARAVEYLHLGTDRCVVHRDIKPSNILLSSSKTPKLCDFGLATWTHGPSLPFLCKTVKGTFGYLAPEYFQHGKLSDKTDIYAYGVVLLELITGRRPIDASRPLGDENLVLWARPHLQEGEAAMEELVDPRLKPGSFNRVELGRLAGAAAACLNSEESARPTIGQILRMLLNGEEGDGDDWSVFSGNGCFIGHSPADLQDSEVKSDMRGHLSLAMLGVSEDEEDELYCR